MTTKKIKQQAHEEFEEQATWEKFGRLTSDKQKAFVKSFIDSLIDKTVQMTEERIVDLIDERVKHMGEPGGFLDSAVRSWGMIYGLEMAKSLITNKSDINK